MTRGQRHLKGRMTGDKDGEQSKLKHNGLHLQGKNETQNQNHDIRK